MFVRVCVCVCVRFAAITALQTYLRCMKENKGFAQFIKDTAKYPECSFHDASDYLSAHHRLHLPFPTHVIP